jgi:hypothetical protein
VPSDEPEDVRDTAGVGGNNCELVDLGDRPPRGTWVPDEPFLFVCRSCAVILPSRTQIPVGSSIPPPPSSYMFTSRIKMQPICHGYSCAMLAYSSRSCSPESPMRMKREVENEKRTSTRPSRFRSAGADSRPLNSERVPYDRKRTEPAGNFASSKKSLMTGRSSKGPFDYDAFSFRTETGRAD